MIVSMGTRKTCLTMCDLCTYDEKEHIENLLQKQKRKKVGVVDGMATTTYILFKTKFLAHILRPISK